MKPTQDIPETMKAVYFEDSDGLKLEVAHS